MKTKKTNPATVSTSNTTETIHAMPAAASAETSNPPALPTVTTVPVSVPTTPPAAGPGPMTPPAPPAPAPDPTNPSVVYVQPPPANALIPPVPSGVLVPTHGIYRAVVPKAGEVSALGGAVTDLQRFANFDQLFGLVAIPRDQVLQAFDVGSQWTTMVKASNEWVRYARIQEGECWANVRSIMAQLKPAMTAAMAADASFATTYPSLARLFGAQKAIAQKAAATRKANKAALAEGKPASHGVVGKRRTKAAAKAALAAKPPASPPPVATTGTPSPVTH